MDLMVMENLFSEETFQESIILRAARSCYSSDTMTSVSPLLKVGTKVYVHLTLRTLSSISYK